MSFFNINYFNAGNLFTLLNEIPTPSTYSSIKLFGNGHFNDLWLEDYTRTQAEIDSLDISVQPIWTIRTKLLALFENNLQAGNIVNLPDPIDKWLVLRKGQNDAKFTKIAELGASVSSYIDRLGVSKENYVYQLIPVANGLLGEPLQSDITPTNFTKVVLLDPELNEGYSFCYDMQLSEIATEEDLIVQDTRGKFQTFLKGNKQVSVGTISVIATSNSITQNELSQDVEFLEGLKAFILNGKPKILKFPKGLTYKVYTSSFFYNRKDGVDSYGNQIYKIGFEYRECGEVM